MVSPWTKTGIVGGVGIVVIILASTLGWILFPDIAVENAIIKEENTAVYDAWKIPPVPIVLQLYLFNCTNCNNEDVLTDYTFKPIMKEVGPFTFAETREKFNITEKDGLLTYRENKLYFYNPQENEVSMSTKITSPNPIYFTLMSLIWESTKIPSSAKTPLSNILHSVLSLEGEYPFMTHTADEMLFSGWSLKGLIAGLQKFLDLLPVDVQLPEDLQISYFGAGNNTNSGVFTIESGANGLDKLGLIRKFDNETKLNFWDDEYCDMINGTDGAIYPPLVDTSKDVYVFEPDLCRAIYATYEKDVTTEGVKSNRFTVPEIVFGDVPTNPDNACYCKRNPNMCTNAGLLDLRSCLFGVPLILSTPHFYLGNPANVLQGMGPSKELHETHFDLEPLTAVPVFASKRIQLNLDVRTYSLPPSLFNLSDIIFPVLWLDEYAKLDAQSAKDINKLLSVINGANIGRWCFLAAGIILVIAAIIMFGVYYSKRGKK